jgi:hypothetical protein
MVYDADYSDTGDDHTLAAAGVLPADSDCGVQLLRLMGYVLTVLSVDV